mmetsp:Transcript_12165/g.42178  ORF Transcript_12165/g.42178 Transcript_12165/m.42178 type:complete len:367 (+) Transcript_12165:500-1600(+)
MAGVWVVLGLLRLHLLRQLLVRLVVARLAPTKEAEEAAPALRLFSRVLHDLGKGGRACCHEVVVHLLLQPGRPLGLRLLEMELRHQVQRLDVPAPGQPGPPAQRHVVHLVLGQHVRAEVHVVHGHPPGVRLALLRPLQQGTLHFVEIRELAVPRVEHVVPEQAQHGRPQVQQQHVALDAAVEVHDQRRLKARREDEHYARRYELLHPKPLLADGERLRGEVVSGHQREEQRRHVAQSLSALGVEQERAEGQQGEAEVRHKHQPEVELPGARHAEADVDDGPRLVGAARVGLDRVAQLRDLHQVLLVLELPLRRIDVARGVLDVPAGLRPPAEGEVAGELVEWEIGEALEVAHHAEAAGAAVVQRAV